MSCHIQSRIFSNSSIGLFRLYIHEWTGCLSERKWSFEWTTLTSPPSSATFSCSVWARSQLKKLLLAPANSQLSYNQYTGGKAQNHAASSNHRIRPPPAVVKVGTHTHKHCHVAYFTLVHIFLCCLWVFLSLSLCSCSVSSLALSPSHSRFSCFGGRL